LTFPLFCFIINRTYVLLFFSSILFWVACSRRPQATQNKSYQLFLTAGGDGMTLLLILMDHQSYLVHKTELPAEQLAAEIGAGDWSDASWQGQWINELPRQVTALDGLVIVSVNRPK